MSCALALSFIFLSVSHSWQAHGAIPDSLARALTARSGFKTLKASYRESIVVPRDKLRIRNYDLRIDQRGEMLIDFFGDDDGKCLISRNDGPSFGSPSDWSGIRFVTDREKKVFYQHLGSHGWVNIVPLRHATGWFCNPLIIGLEPGIGPSLRTDADLLAHYSSGQYRFEEHVEDDGRIVVQGYHPPEKPTLEYVWVIDPAMDHAVREVEHYSLSESGARRRIWHGSNDYQLVQGRWWPRLVSIEADSGESRLILTCVWIEFDKPEHPQSFNGIDSLAPVGVEVRGAVASSPGKQKLSFMRYIGGGKIVSEEEFNAQKDRYDLEPLRQWQREIENNRRYLPEWATDASGRLGVQDVEWDLDLWVTYVRRWIILHSNPSPSLVSQRTRSPSSRPVESRFDPLDGSQKDAAYGILADCKKRAEAVTRIRKFRIADLTKQLTQFDATTQKDPKQAEKLKEQIEWLRSERDPKVAAIFDELKKRLELTLRSTQAHRPPATSQPAP